MWANTTDYDQLKLVSFRFRIGLHGISTPTDLVMVTTELRDLAAQHPDLEIYTYQYSRAIADQVGLSIAAAPKPLKTARRLLINPILNFFNAL